MKKLKTIMFLAFFGLGILASLEAQAQSGLLCEGEGRDYRYSFSTTSTVLTHAFRIRDGVTVRKKADDRVVGTLSGWKVEYWTEWGSIKYVLPGRSDVGLWIVYEGGVPAYRFGLVHAGSTTQGFCVDP